MSEAISQQIVRLLDACDNRYSALRLVEPLIDACDARYEEFRGADFAKARLISRAEAVAALIERGGNLPATPVLLDDEDPSPIPSHSPSGMGGARGG